MSWTEERKQIVIDRYLELEPTPENSVELVKQIAEELEETPNGVRQVLMQAQVYIKKDVGATTTKPSGSTTSGSDGAKRVSKESQLAALRLAINATGAGVDEDILSKLTGKAAAYFTAILTK